MSKIGRKCLIIANSTGGGKYIIVIPDSDLESISLITLCWVLFNLHSINLIIQNCQAKPDLLVVGYFNYINVCCIMAAMKKILILLVMMFALNVSAFAVANNADDKVKISLQEAMDLALKGNIELQEQRKNLGISQNDIEVANALKNPQIQSNLLMGPIAKANSSQVGVMLPVEVAKRGARSFSC